MAGKGHFLACTIIPISTDNKVSQSRGCHMSSIKREISNDKLDEMTPFIDARMAQFLASSPDLQNRQLEYLSIKAPTHKSDWAVQLSFTPSGVSCSRVIKKYGLDRSIKSCFEILAYHLGIKSKACVTYQVLESLYLKKLRRDYYAQYKALVLAGTTKAEKKDSLGNAA